LSSAHSPTPLPSLLLCGAVFGSFLRKLFCYRFPNIEVEKVAVAVLELEKPKARVRRTQFLKQMEPFILRGVVSEDCSYKRLVILRAVDARKGKGNADMNRENEVEEALPPKHRDLLDCICCEHTQPPDRVVCRAEVS
jgi:hypothetical protein